MKTMRMFSVAQILFNFSLTPRTYGVHRSSVVAGWARVVGEVPGTVLTGLLHKSSWKTIGQEDILQMVQFWLSGFWVTDVVCPILHAS